MKYIPDSTCCDTISRGRRDHHLKAGIENEPVYSAVSKPAKTRTRFKLHFPHLAATVVPTKYNTPSTSTVVKSMIHPHTPTYEGNLVYGPSAIYSCSSTIQWEPLYKTWILQMYGYDAG